MANDQVRNLFNTKQERRETAEDMVTLGMRRMRIALVTACYSVWIIACCTGPACDVVGWAGALGLDGAFGMDATGVQGLLMPAWLGPLLAMAVASMVIAVWFRRTRRVPDSPAWLVVLASVMTLAAALHLMWALDRGLPPLADVALYGSASVLMGAGAALFRVEIDRVFGWIGTQQTLCQGMIGTVAAVVALTLCSIVGQSVAGEPIVLYGISLALPFLMMLLLRRVVRDFPRARYFAHGKDVDLPFPTKFVVTSAVQGLAAGVLYMSLFIYVGSATTSSADILIGQLIAAVALFVTLMLVRIDFNRLIYKLSFPLVALGFVLIAVAPVAFGGALVVLAWGFCYLDMVLWSLGACLMKNMGLPATWIASCPGAALFSGVVVGAAITGCVLEGHPLDQTAVFASLVACFVLAAALLMSSGSNLKYGWGTIRPGEGGLEMADVAGVARFCATERGLTQRESEVMLLLVQGKTRRAICEELTVSPDTVKTHVRAVYRKINVHSQQELIDFVARERERIAPEELKTDVLD